MAGCEQCEIFLAGFCFLLGFASELLRALAERSGGAAWEGGLPAVRIDDKRAVPTTAEVEVGHARRSARLIRVSAVIGLSRRARPTARRGRGGVGWRAARCTGRGGTVQTPNPSPEADLDRVHPQP